ncbi:MAG: UDP-glucose/GDP-mannose dehydrogenase family protein [Tissierellia bacterium]|nr:UDP-glucose/GDP-mannose dehydrogenase family protein [Tissierellia bacterium]
MKIAIVGTGYVGLVTGACFSEVGIDVVCIDINEEKIKNLRNGVIPIFETGLEDIVRRNVDAGRLTFETDLIKVLHDVDIVFIAVGTPPDEDGSADLSYVLNVAKNIGQNLEKYILVVTKSTVPVGTAEKVRNAINEELNKRGKDIIFDVASNPEFLKEGNAVEDFLKPDRVVVGLDSTKAKSLMEKLYKPFMMNNNRMIFTDIPSAEMIKYASNAMLATRISFMNDIANLCELVGADVNMVRKGVGSDTRIGSKFLYPGTGYGGSCFPKDVKALIKTASEYGYDMEVLNAVESVNDKQKNILFKKLFKHYNGNLRGKTIAVLGLSFKPDTDDMREAPSLVIINSLLKEGCKVKVYDPIAMNECKRILGNKVEYCNTSYDAVVDSDALLLVTEWKELRVLSWRKLKKIMRNPLVLDGRNIYDRKELEEIGFKYYNIGG